MALLTQMSAAAAAQTNNKQCQAAAVSLLCVAVLCVAVLCCATVDFFVLQRGNNAGDGLFAFERNTPKDVIFLGPSQEMWVIARCAHLALCCLHRSICCRNATREPWLALYWLALYGAFMAQASAMQQQRSTEQNNTPRHCTSKTGRELVHPTCTCPWLHNVLL
jgi:hypothetical protein